MMDQQKTARSDTWNTIRPFFKRHVKAAGALCLVLTFLGGYWIRGDTRPELTAPTPEELAKMSGLQPGNENVLYACPMMCIPPRESPGLCPVCGMELFAVPKGDHDHDGEPPRIELTEAADVMAEVELAPVEKKFVSVRVKTFGQVVASPDSFVAGDPKGLMARLFVYESDFPKIRLGQEVTFVTDAYPGVTFKGSIAFIGLVNDAYTRTFNVGAIFEDTQNLLIPGMIVRADIKTVVTGRGGVADVNAPLSLAPTVIPSSAPLITGERAVVYVAVPGLDRTYEGREVVLGPRAEDYYIVFSGLEPGEMVVAKGAFKIDSALQIQARPSMMNPAAAQKRPFGE
ncbi:MAG: efflux RND transporter periplasmic adaptor subunit [Deltaproteobacteria bacterium]|nr:efflux RND transporter periplasmic adaptor subunit [Deltaproteobacteria bacterium]